MLAPPPRKPCIGGRRRFCCESCDKLLLYRGGATIGYENAEAEPLPARSGLKWSSGPKVNRDVLENGCGK